MIKITDLFEVDENNIPIQKPINRNAFTSEDVKYKVKCVKIMRKLRKSYQGQNGKFMSYYSWKNSSQ